MKKTEKTKPVKKKKPMPMGKMITLTTLLVVLVLILSIITTSYSWFTPAAVKSTGIEYVSNGGYRSENCTIKNYYGRKTGDGVVYNPSWEITTATSVTSFDADTTDSPTTTHITISGLSTCTVKANKTGYFMTEITNSDNVYPTVVSLFLSSSPSSSNAFGFGVSYPSNSYRSLTSEQTDFWIIRNAYIEQNDGNNEGASMTIEWFIKAGSSDVTFDLRKMYLMYS